MNWEKNKDVPPEELEAAVEQAVREVRGKTASRRTKGRKLPE
jgi:hypothetical protein